MSPTPQLGTFIPTQPDLRQKSFLPGLLRLQCPEIQSLNVNRVSQQSDFTYLLAQGRAAPPLQDALWISQPLTPLHSDSHGNSVATTRRLQTQCSQGVESHICYMKLILLWYNTLQYCSPYYYRSTTSFLIQTNFTGDACLAHHRTGAQKKVTVYLLEAPCA